MPRRSPEATISSAPELSVEAKREAEKTNVADFLIKFQELRNEVRGVAYEDLTDIQHAIAEGKNTLSKPKNIILEWRRDHMQKRFDRWSSRQDTSRFDAVNRFYDWRAEKSAGKLENRTQAFDIHSNMMEQRLEAVDSKGQEREAAIEAKRKELIEAKMKAIENKLIRHERHQRRKELESFKLKYTYEEREAAVNKFLDQESIKKRIREQAKHILQQQFNLNLAPA